MISITVKTLQQTSFSLEIDSEEKILQVKQKIESLNGSPVDKQKLIYSGKVLDNDRTVGFYGINDGEMLVLMITKQTAQKIATLTASTAAQPIVQPSNNEQSSSNISNNQPVVVPIVGETTGIAERTASTGSSTMGDISETTIGCIMELGFSREDVVKALQASFGNPDRAVEYLMNGYIPTVGAGEGADDGNMLGSLRNSPEFQRSLAMLQQNPELLNHLLQQLSHSNPELFRAIQSNPQAFIETLQGMSSGGTGVGLDGEGEENDPSNHQHLHDEQERELELTQEEAERFTSAGGATSEESPNVIRITEQENEAINRLCGLGFDKSRAAEAYFACDKNEELAANYLFDHLNETNF